MAAILAVTLPFFAVVALGFAARWRGMVDDAAAKAINVFVFYFALPALLVRTLGGQPWGDIVEPRFLIAWLIAGLVVFAMGGGFARAVIGVRGGGLAIDGQAASVGNIGFLGLPLLIELLGDWAAGPVAMALVIDVALIVPLSMALIAGMGGADGDTSGGPLRAAGRALNGLVANPFIWSILAGLALAASGWTLPQPIDLLLRFLGQAAGPAALFALGISLYSRKMAEAAGEIAGLTVLKLVVHPLIALAALTLAGVPAAFVVAGTLLAGLPVANNVFVVAQAFGVHVRRASAVILVTTVLAVASVSAWAWLLTHGFAPAN